MSIYFVAIHSSAAKIGHWCWYH